VSLLRWLLDDVSWWVKGPISLAVWVLAAAGFYRYIDPPRHKAIEVWLTALFVGAVAALLWPWALIFGVPLTLGLGGIWALAMLVAHPPRRRLPPPTTHWTDALPADTPIERVVELAEQKATERQRPSPSVRTWM
jgi:hypothetical protein